MLIFSLLSPRWFVPGQPRNRLRRASGGRGRQTLPRLEALEDRTCPSTLTVQTNADSGPGSLRAAITAAANGDTIVFDHRLSGQTVTLKSGELAIGKD